MIDHLEQKGRGKVNFFNDRFKMMSPSILSMIILLLVASLAWYLIHKPPHIAGDIYPYLTSIDADLIAESWEDGIGGSADTWANLLALRSTLKKEDCQTLLSSIHDLSLLDTDTFNQVIKRLPESSQAEVQRHLQILLSHPYYEPGHYSFPCPLNVWLEDSFGADREGGKRTHQGTDLFAAEGTPIFSVCSGKIEELGWNRLGGERVGVRGLDGNYYYYAHLETIASG